MSKGRPITGWLGSNSRPGCTSRLLRSFGTCKITITSWISKGTSRAEEEAKGWRKRACTSQMLNRGGREHSRCRHRINTLAGMLVVSGLVLKREVLQILFKNVSANISSSNDLLLILLLIHMILYVHDRIWGDNKNI